MVRATEILDIIEIIYYVPAFLCSLYVIKKHGLSREAGWILITVLSILRIVGSSTGIAAVHNPSVGLITASLICSSIGSATLVAALTGIVNRVNAGTGLKAFPPRFTRMLQLIGIAAIVLGIIGGTDQSSTDPDKRASGQTYTKVAVILILIQLLASAFIAAHSTFNISSVMQGDRRLLFISLASLPFLLVRVVYSICSAFDPGSSVFSRTSNTITAVVVRAIMAIAMEFIVVALFLFGGCTSPRLAEPAEANIAEGAELLQDHQASQFNQYHHQDQDNYRQGQSKV